MPSMGPMAEDEIIHFNIDIVDSVDIIEVIYYR